jgi:hypothetical protein
MDSSIYISELVDNYKKEFPAGWIDNQFDWSGRTAKGENLKVGLGKILSYRRLAFCNYAKLVLSGDFLEHDASTGLQQLEQFFTEEVVPKGKDTKNKLLMSYSQMLDSLKVSNDIVRYHVENVRTRLEQKNENDFFTVVKINKDLPNDDKLLRLLDCICDACWLEYCFSYNDHFIKNVLIIKEYLLELTALDTDSAFIRDATVRKLDFLLYKLSRFSKNGKITYNYNFRHVDFHPSEVEKGCYGEMIEHFCEYLDPNTITSEKVLEWQKESHNKDVSLWSLSMLMRYYVKVFKNFSQIDNLLALNDKQFDDTLPIETNIVNAYADKSARNYMYNSRFSFRCQCMKDYTLQQMRADLDEIEAIQNETLIINYHPYQKAFEFSLQKTLEHMRIGEPKSIIEDDVDYLQYYYEKFKRSLEWCKKYQPYTMQLRFNFSTIVDTLKDSEGEMKQSINVFCPSSFMRPLRFSYLEEKKVEFETKLYMLRNDLEYYEERSQIKTMKQDMETKMEEVNKKAFEQMSFFSAVVIFLVGLITIFTGNDAKVPLIDKFQYVIILGVLLLLFVCLGHFVITPRYEKGKPWIFGGLTVSFILILLWYFLRNF